MTGPLGREWDRSCQLEVHNEKWHSLHDETYFMWLLIIYHPGISIKIILIDRIENNASKMNHSSIESFNESGSNQLLFSWLRYDSKYKNFWRFYFEDLNTNLNRAEPSGVPPYHRVTITRTLPQLCWCNSCANLSPAPRSPQSSWPA